MACAGRVGGPTSATPARRQYDDRSRVHGVLDDAGLVSQPQKEESP